MKNKSFIPALAITAISLTGCLDDSRIITYKANVPVYLAYDQVEKVYSSSPAEINKAGKIYLSGNYLFVNDLEKGIHIIDNSNPSAPNTISFLNIPGNVDVAVKDNILYADNFTDLVAIDINNISSASVVKRIPDQFPYSIPEYDPQYPVVELDTSIGMVVSWEVKDVTRKCKSRNNCPEYVNTGGVEVNESYEVYSFGASTSSSSSGSGKSTMQLKRNVGIGGSLGRFTVYNDYLYLGSKNILKVYDISSASNPVFITQVVVQTGGDGIESLFNYDDKLFIGSPVGVYIYNLSNPSSPSYISRFEHVRRCDPVVVSGNYAYSTMRGDAGCGGFVSELSVINISNISNPSLAESYDMDDPYGLGLDNNTLFVCDGKSGLKVYDIQSTPNLTLKNHYTNLIANDVIPWDNVLILIGTTGLYQYDYSDPQNLTLLSQIPIK
ncbi:MAG: hypothetical protein HYY40_02410 [Bacteroidetes bacterium]|nr:hypothetical protein [Bacteroidota bacterium]